MKATYTTRNNMARSFGARGAAARPLLRECNQRRMERMRRVVQARKEILQRKVHERGPSNRPLTGNLLRNADTNVRGLAGEIANAAPHAQIRNDQSGRSVRYGYDKELHFAEDGVARARKDNRADVQATLRRIMARGR